MSFKLQETEKELSLFKSLPSLINENNQKLISLKFSEELLQEGLAIGKNSKNPYKDSEKTVIFSHEYYLNNQPHRSWTISSELLQLNSLKSKIISLITTNNK